MRKSPSYHRGRRRYDEFNRRHGRVDPYELSQARLLEVLDISPQAAESLVEHGNGSIYRLIGVDTEELEILPGVGKATLARLTAHFALIDHWERERDTILAELETREAAPGAETSQGDVA